MTVAVLAVAIQAAIGIPLGLIAGYVGGDGGWPHCAGRRPQLGASLGGETLGALAVPFLVLVIGLAEWPYFTRIVGAAALVEAAKDHIRAVRALGASDAAIVRQHTLPNILSPLIVVATT